MDKGLIIVWVTFIFWPFFQPKKIKVIHHVIIHALPIWSIIKIRIFVLEFANSRTKACDRPINLRSKDRFLARVVTRTLNYLEQLPGHKVRIHKAENKGVLLLWNKMHIKST